MSRPAGDKHVRVAKSPRAEALAFAGSLTQAEEEGKFAFARDCADVEQMMHSVE